MREKSTLVLTHTSVSSRGLWGDKCTRKELGSAPRAEPGLPGRPGGGKQQPSCGHHPTESSCGSLGLGAEAVLTTQQHSGIHLGAVNRQDTRQDPRPGLQISHWGNFIWNSYDTAIVSILCYFRAYYVTVADNLGGRVA